MFNVASASTPFETTPARVGVRLLMVTLPVASVRSWIAFATIAALIAPTGTFAVALTPQLLSLAKNLRPQLTSVSVAETTWLTAGAMTDHLEAAPQPGAAHATFMMSSFIDPDAS